jgi:TonB family protein
MLNSHLKKRGPFLCLALAGLSSLVLVQTAFPQTDPFYLRLLEKAQKSFLAKNYADAARDFEIAAFGLSQDTTLQAKAYFCAGLAQYYLNDPKKGESLLRLGAELLGDRNLAVLEIPDSALTDLRKLLTFFNIQVAFPAPAVSPPPVQEQGNQAANPKPAPETGQAKRPAEKKAAADSKKEPEGSPPITLDKIKEGDIIPLDMAHTPPVATRRVAAVYPSSAAGSGITGTVVVNALISEKGTVVKSKITQGMKGAAGFDQAALQAVRRWRFEPATVNGIKVKVWLPINIVFKQRE